MRDAEDAIFYAGFACGEFVPSETSFAMKTLPALLPIALFLVARPANASIGASEPPLTHWIDMRQPVICRDAGVCAAACVDGIDESACLWIDVSIAGSGIKTLDREKARERAGQICLMSPALCGFDPYMTLSAHDFESGFCDEDHPAMCLRQVTYGTDFDEAGGPGEEDERALKVSRARCESGLPRYCAAIDDALGNENPQNVPLHTLVRTALKSQCEDDDPRACLELLDIFERERRNGDEPDEEEKQLALRAKAIYRRACVRDDDWLACMRAGNFNDPGGEPEPRLRNQIRNRSRGLMEAYFRARCEKHDPEGCRDARTVRLALAVDGNDGGRYLDDLSSLDRECFKGGLPESCIEAGRAMLLVEGESGLGRARKLLQHACGKGGCEALVKFIDSRWNTMRAISPEAEEWRRKGCAAGESNLCPIHSPDGSIANLTGDDTPLFNLRIPEFAY